MGTRMRRWGSLVGDPRYRGDNDANRAGVPDEGHVGDGGLGLRLGLHDRSAARDQWQVLLWSYGPSRNLADRIQLYMQDGTNVSTKLDIGMGDNHSARADIMDLPVKQWFHLALTWNNGVVLRLCEQRAGGHRYLHAA